MRFQSRIIDGILSPLSVYYNDPLAIEVRVNRPGFIVMEKRNVKDKYQIQVPQLTIARIERACRALANRYQLHFDPLENPTLSCALREGHRFQCTVGTSVRNGVALAIRCKHPYVPTWEEMGIDPWLQDFLQQIMERRWNILISGATNTGKTTMVNRLLQFLPPEARIIFGEDTLEIDTDRFWDGVSFLAARHEKSARGQLGWGEIYDATNRLTPTRVIFGELSRENTEGVLNFLNAGNGGFLCTLHSDSPEQALKYKFDQMLSSVGSSMSSVTDYVEEMIDVVIQIKHRKVGDRTVRRISDILVLAKDTHKRPAHHVVQNFERTGLLDYGESYA